MKKNRYRMLRGEKCAWLGKGKRKRKRGLRILSAGLSLSIVLTGFGSLPDEVREQSVPLGTNIEELNLPDTVEAYVADGDAKNEGGGVKPPEDSEGDKDGQDKTPGEGDGDNNDGGKEGGTGGNNSGGGNSGMGDNSNGGGNDDGTGTPETSDSAVH